MPNGRRAPLDATAIVEDDRSLTLSRRHAAGAPSARGLLYTLLGFMLFDDGTAWTSAIITTLGRLGVEEKATRQALMRTGDEGWLDSERHGRQTRWRLTDSARAVLTDVAERIDAFTGPAEDWDGQWLLISARIPETDRNARRVVGSRLNWVGFGSLAPGLWISPHAEREAEAVRALEQAGVAKDAHVFVATRTGVAGPPALVASAWDLQAIEAQYERFLSDFQARGAGNDPLTRILQLVHTWRRFPSIDPVLPKHLLPPRWVGLKAAKLFSDRHEHWLAPAQRAWQGLNEFD